MLISVISLQIFSKFINETSGYHQYIINKSWIPVVPHKAVAEVSKIGNL